MSKTEMWKMEAKGSDILELSIYSNVEGDSYDLWTGKTIASETSAKHFKAELDKHPDVKEIRVYINSLGGSVLEGLAICNQLKRHPAHKTVIIDGFACSIASVIAMAGDTVIMPKSAMMMIHNPWTIALGNADEMRKVADDLDKLGEGVRQAYLEKAGDKLDEGKLIEMLAAETYLTAEECIAYGLADAHEEEKPEETEPEEKAQARAKVEQARQEAARLAAEKELTARREKAAAAIEKYFT